MIQSRRDRRDWRVFWVVNIVSAIGGAIFSLRVSPPDQTLMMSIAQGIATALFIATPIVTFELRSSRPGMLHRLRRLPLTVYFLVRLALYLVVIVGGLALTRVLLSPQFQFDHTFRMSLVFAVITSVGFNLVFELGGLLGFGTLKNLLTGRYVQPQQELRAFLLIDMRDSTGMAERLGPIRFHELLNDFFRDVSAAVLECEGEIHKYVGDEAIVTWEGGTALSDGECLRCPFVVQDLIERHEKHYLQRYGAVPAFRAAVHYGEIVAGEIGDVRREIAYVGDTLNSAARLLDAAKELKRDVLASADLLGQTALPEGITAEKLPTLNVRGRAQPLGVSALVRA
ncbi:MAG TPA: adenylate/guanylate cyclase domain-containing protein [Reyranella sp.]|nr:adenylate/guanylate cyclase domain-containing protein [Reyranella sp.]